MQSNPDCVICLEKINGEPITTPCCHTMHNKCLTPWLLLEDTCPLCRHNIGTQFSETNKLGASLEIKFTNNIITSHYYKLRNALREIMIYLSEGEEDIYTKNVWTTNGDNTFYLKLKTKQQIIDIEVDCEEIDNNMKTLYITFSCIDKKSRKQHRKNNILVSNYNQRKLPRHSFHSRRFK
jgi:hypothetical protein